MSRYARRIDKNQPEVTEELRSLGFSIIFTYTIGKGIPDFMVGFLGLNLWVELKSGNGKLTTDETEFHSEYKGYVIIANSTLDVLEGFLSYSIKLDNDRESSFQTIELTKILKAYDNGKNNN